MGSRSHSRRSWGRAACAATVSVTLALGGTALLATAAGASPGGNPGGTSLTLYVDQNGTGDDCLQSAPCASIGLAIEYADEFTGNTGFTADIEVGPGTYGEDDDEIGSGEAMPPVNVTITGVAGQTYVEPTSGGGEGQTGFSLFCGTLTLQDLNFSGYAAGVDNECGNLIIDNSTFEFNDTGVYVEDGDGSATVTARNSTFFRNDGGLVTGGDQATLDSDSFLYSYDDGVTGFSGNVNVANSTFYENDEAIWNPEANLTVSNSTIDLNTVGVDNDDSASMFGTIDVNNYDDNCAGEDPITDDGFNMDNFGDCDFSNTTGSITGVDPTLGSPQNNGGDTWTQAILPTSAAYQVIPVSECPTFDQRGESRPQPSTSNYCDIGAYEYAPPASIEIQSSPITGPTSATENLGGVNVAVFDAAGFPAVSDHAIDLLLSSTAPETQFGESEGGTSTNQVEIPSGSTCGSFYFGSYLPQSVPISVTGWNLNTNLGTKTQTETVVTGPPATITITAGNDQSVDVGTDYTPLSVNVVDGTGNPEMDSAVTFTITGDATFPDDQSSVVVNTDDDGNVTAPTLTAGTTPGAVTVTAATTTVGVTATFSETNLVGPPSSLAIEEGNDQSAQVTDTFETDLSTTLTDMYGNPIEGDTITYTVSNGSANFTGAGTDTQVTDGSGDTTADTLTAGTVSGTQQITAAVSGYDVSATFSGIVIDPGPAANISITSGNNQTALSTLNFKTPLSTVVTDSYGNPIEGDTVIYDVTKGSALFSSGPTSQLTTNASGATSVTLIAGLHVGTESVNASVQSTSVSTNFSGLKITAPVITSTISSFKLDSTVLTSTMKSEIAFLAVEIDLVGYNKVSLTGYSSITGTTGENSKLSLNRARAVKLYLESQLKSLSAGPVTITAVGKGATKFIHGNGNLAANRRVVAVLS